MRSRYSAYVLGLVDYLVATTLPAQQPNLTAMPSAPGAHRAPGSALKWKAPRCLAASRNMPL